MGQRGQYTERAVLDYACNQMYNLLLRYDKKKKLYNSKFFIFPTVQVITRKEHAIELSHRQLRDCLIKVMGRIWSEDLPDINKLRIAKRTGSKVPEEYRDKKRTRFDDNGLVLETVENTKKVELEKAQPFSNSAKSSKQKQVKEKSSKKRDISKPEAQKEISKVNGKEVDVNEAEAKQRTVDATNKRNDDILLDVYPGKVKAKIHHVADPTKRLVSDVQKALTKFVSKLPNAECIKRVVVKQDAEIAADKVCDLDILNAFVGKMEEKMKKRYCEEKKDREPSMLVSELAKQMVWMFWKLRLPHNPVYESLVLMSGDKNNISSIALELVAWLIYAVSREVEDGNGGFYI